MKIQKLNNVSFKALMIENGKNISSEQKDLLKRIIINHELDGRAIFNLESVNADVYVCANDDGKTADVKLKKSAGVIYNYVPNDDAGSIKSRFLPSDTEDDISRKLQNFIARAKVMFRYESNNKPINAAMEEKLQEIYDNGTDIAEEFKSDIVPNAVCYFGTPCVITKQMLKNRE